MREPVPWLREGGRYRKFQRSSTALRFVGVGSVVILVVASAVLVFAPPGGGSSPASAQSVQYTIVDLGTLPGGQTSTAYDVNDAGQVVGESNSASTSTLHAALWEGGTVTDLGHRGGPTNFSVATAINAQGQIAGYGRVPYSPDTRALLWKDGAMMDVQMARAYDMNDRTQVAGGSNPSPSSSALRWENGTTTDLGAYGGQAFGINNPGQIVGPFRACCYSIHAFIWEDGTLTDLGPGSPVAINDAGQMVGGASTAYILDNGTVTYLGTLGGSSSAAYDINNHRQVVGSSTNASGAWHAFVWESGTMQDLGTLPGGSESSAYGINGLGQIVGSSRDAAGDLHAVRWEGDDATHDIAVVSASADPVVADVGSPITITATVENQGNRPETFTVNALADSVEVGTQTVVNLAPGASTIVSFTWETSTFGPGPYSVRVTSVPVAGETDLGDNELHAGTVILLPAPPFDPGLPPK